MFNMQNLFIKIDGVSNREIPINIVREPSLFSPLQNFEQIQTNNTMENYTRKLNSFESYAFEISFNIFECTPEKIMKIKEWIIGNGYKKRIELGWEQEFYHIGTIAETVEITSTEDFRFKQFTLIINLEPVFYKIEEDEYTINENELNIINTGNIDSKPLIKIYPKIQENEIKFNLNGECYFKLLSGHNSECVYIDLKHNLIYNQNGDNLMIYLDYMDLQSIDYYGMVLNDISNFYLHKGLNTIGSYASGDTETNIGAIHIKNQSFFI